MERRGVDDPASAASIDATDEAATAREGEVPRPDPNDPRSLEQHLADASLAAQVKLALVEEKQLRLFEFEPEVRQGVVVLHGDVPSVNQYTLAEQVARTVPGVREVRNAIEAPGVDLLTDEASAPPRPPDTLADVSNPTSPAPSTSADTSSAEEEPASAAYHTVKSGESLWIIARENGTTVAAIKRLNDMKSDRLRPGQRIRIR